MKPVVKITIIVLGIILATNILFLDYFVFRNQKQNLQLSLPLISQEKSETKEAVVTVNSCAEKCKKQISDEIQKEIEELKSTLIAGQSGTSAPQKIAIPAVKAQEPKVIYVPLASEGTTVSTSWADIASSEFYFNLTDYPGTKSVRYEAHLLALHGSARVFTRLYDATNFRGVDYSELSTQNDSYTRLESSPITIWRGNNKYTVQLRSINGTEAKLKDARLKIYY